MIFIKIPCKQAGRQAVLGFVVGACNVGYVLTGDNLPGAYNTTTKYFIFNLQTNKLNYVLTTVGAFTVQNHLGKLTATKKSWAEFKQKDEFCTSRVFTICSQQAQQISFPVGLHQENV